MRYRQQRPREACSSLPCPILSLLGLKKSKKDFSFSTKQNPKKKKKKQMGGEKLSYFPLPSRTPLSSRATTRGKPDPRTRQIVHDPEPLLLDIPKNRQSAQRTGKRKAEGTISIHRDQIICRRQRQVSASKMQHHRWYLHLRHPGQVKARVEQ